MAEASIKVNLDQFTCPVCLDLLKDPVTINCGHCFCVTCINDCWNQDDQRGVYRCPQCREIFTPRPVLRRNNMLAEVVEKMQETELQESSAHCNAGPGDVECEFCTGRKHKAVKTCLMCMASFCETHLKPHYDVPGLKKHKLISVSAQLQEKICCSHGRPLEVFCHTDHQCICFECTLNDHKGHDTVSAAEIRSEKQKDSESLRIKHKIRIQEREKEVQDVKQALKSLKLVTEETVQKVDGIFTSLLLSICKRCDGIKKLIMAQEEVQLSSSERVLQQLEQEIAELTRREEALRELSRTEDHVHFIQEFQTLSASLGVKQVPSISVNPHLSFVDVKNLVSALKRQIDQICKEEFHKIYRVVTKVEVLLPRLERNFYNTPVTSPWIQILHTGSSQWGMETERWVWSEHGQLYPNHPERFEHFIQVLCKPSLPEHCYWDGTAVFIAVSYKEICKRGFNIDANFGLNQQLWTLFCSPYGHYFRHNIDAPSSKRIGVYLDYRAGKLCFYAVSDTVNLLHGLQTTFTQPVYAGFQVNKSTRVQMKC